MGRRRAHLPTARAEVADVMPVSARVAWSYLSALLAAVGAGVLMVVSNQTLAVVLCTSAGGTDDAGASCKLAVAIWVTIVGFLACLAVSLLLLKLDWWLWGTMAALLGLIVAADGVTDWWWWIAAALTPAAAALLSANWQRGSDFRRVQLGVLVALMVAAAGALVWWYTQG